MDPFSDIAAAGDSGGQFESFAQQFLEALGLVVVVSTSRGPDGGRDLIVAERFTTKFGREIDYKWLVSCKFRSNGRTISPLEEQMIIDRLQRNDCNGFIAFYSTGPSTNLSTHIEALRITKVAQVHLFDAVTFTGSDIVSKLNADPARFGAIMQTFMPAYYAQHYGAGTQQANGFNLEEDNHE